MKKYIPDVGVLLLIAIVVGIFFFRLFWPIQQLIVTPDFGRSDAWHFSFGQKYALWQSLQQSHLPLWNKDVGDGFPMFAEGQTGALFLPNLILFSLPNPVIAYNLALVLAILMLGWGMYWSCRLLKFSPIPSLFGALILTFSGLPILHLTHITLLQGFSLMPVMVALTLKLSRRSFAWIGLWAFIGAQQLFAGFPQATFLTMLLCAGFILKNPGSTWRFLLAFGLMIGLGAAQLIPSAEFLRQSTHPNGFDPSSASLYSFPLKHLLTFVAPFALGNPKFGTYPPFYEFDGSIFWENTAYLGIVPLLFACLAKKRRFTLFLLVTAGLSLLLAWGKYSPLYLVYSFWPFTLFRVPSRFLWIVVFCIVFLAIAGFQKYVRNRLIIIIAFLNIPILMATWWSYHMIVPAKSWLEAPESTRTISSRVLTIGGPETHNKLFTSTGWQRAQPYFFLREGLAPESNLIWNIAQHDVLSGRSIRRSSITSTLLADSIKLSDTQATLSAQTMKYLGLFNIRTILSWVPLSGQIPKPIKIITDSGLTLSVYDTSLPQSRVRVVGEATVAATLTQAYKILSDPTFEPDQTVLLESHEAGPRATDGAQKHTETVIVTRDDHEHISISIKDNPGDGFLVLADTYYPGWVARVDNRETPILAANLSQRAIVLPQGTHTVTFDYEGKSVELGKRISLTSLGAIILGAALQILIAKHRTGKKILWRARHP